MTNTMTKGRGDPLIYPDPATVRRVYVEGGEPGREYYSDQRGSLFYKTDRGGFVWMQMKGKWLEVEPPGKPTPPTTLTSLTQRLTPDTVPTPTSRRYSFAYATTIRGIPGELTIEADSANDMINALKQAITHFKPAVKAEDEFFVMLADGTAFCRKHGEAMRLREKQGDSWWSHDTGGECWCRGRPGKDSPGWDK